MPPEQPAQRDDPLAHRLNSNRARHPPKPAARHPPRLSRGIRRALCGLRRYWLHGSNRDPSGTGDAAPPPARHATSRTGHRAPLVVHPAASRLPGTGNALSSTRPAVSSSPIRPRRLLRRPADFSALHAD